MKNLYLFCAIVGTIIPCAFFGAFMFVHGVSLSEFVAQLLRTRQTVDLRLTY